jgi:hypothetical protein
MPKSVAAEWFLRLFTTPDRAAALAGDMSEEGRVSWWDTLHTAAALFFKSIAGAPVRVFFLLLLGAFLEMACHNLASLPIRFHNFQRSEVWMIITLFFVTDYFLAPALTGYALVRLARGRDITACVAYVIMSVTLPLYMMILHVGAEIRIGRPWWVAVGNQALRLALPALILLAAGSLARRRELRRVAA